MGDGLGRRPGEIGRGAAAGPDLATRPARLVYEAFRRYDGNFRRITQRARRRFATRDWAGGRADLAERLDLWDKSVGRTVEALREALGPRATDRRLWLHVKQAYGTRVDGFADAELARTFFTSVSRRVLGTVGVDPLVEFVLDLEPARGEIAAPRTRVHLDWGDAAELFARVLATAPVEPAVADPRGDARRCAAELERLAWRHYRHPRTLLRVEVLEPVFFRSDRAYLVGKVEGEGWVAPLAVELRHDEAGVAVQALHMSDDAMAIVFGFTRSSFFVDAEPVCGVVRFLEPLLPGKPVDELYSVLGRIRQGKTERYRELARVLRRTDERFGPAPGQKGLVMIVFALPSHHLVFKVIRDRFGPGKRVTRSQVRERYRLVSRHDRVGRLVDVQAFRNVALPRERFGEDVLEELTAQAARTVHADGGSLVFEHLYMERKVRPLDLFLGEATWARARAAVEDWGEAIKDLARTGLFPGDMLLKNFGVTRHGRVVFYDFDEVVPLDDCRFRALPRHADDLLEMSAEPWGSVGEDDVFPEQFDRFLGLRPELREVFLARHRELLDPAWWRRVQGAQRAPGRDVTPRG